MTRLPPQLAMELWVLRPYTRQFVLLPAMGLLFGFLQDTVVPMMMVMAVLTGSYGFVITEQARLETLFATLPTSRRRIVVARYAVAAGIVLLLGLAGVGFDVVIATIRQQEWSPVSSLTTLGACLAAAGIVLGIQFPFYFALGYTRAKFVTWLALAAVGALVGMGMATTMTGGTPFDWPDPGGPVWAPIAGGPLVGLAALAVSAAVSVRLYARKDL